VKHGVICIYVDILVMSTNSCQSLLIFDLYSNMFPSSAEIDVATVNQWRISYCNGRRITEIGLHLSKLW